MPFRIHEHEFSVDQISEGLIHHTLRSPVNLPANLILLQEINTMYLLHRQCCKAIIKIIGLSPYNRKSAFAMPKPKLFAGEIPLFFDSHGKCWRIFEFIEGSQTFTTARTISPGESGCQDLCKLYCGFASSMLINCK